MRRLWLGFALVLAFLGVNFASAQLPPGPVPTLHVMSFCSAGCDSTATTFTVPAGTQQLWSTYCGSGGSGAGGVAAALNGGGGGGGGAVCLVNYPVAASPGTVITHIVAAGPAGGSAAGVVGANGVAEYLTWTQGAFSFSSPAAWPGQYGNVGTATNGGAGGESGATINTSASSGLGSPITSNGGGVTGTGAGANGGSQTGGGGIYWNGTGAGAGGGPSSAGGGARIYQLNGATGQIPGGAATTTTCGGGGGGGSTIFSLGGAGGAGAVGADATGAGAGGGGGSCDFGGGKGGETLVIYSWIQ